MVVVSSKKVDSLRYAVLPGCALPKCAEDKNDSNTTDSVTNIMVYIGRSYPTIDGGELVLLLDAVPCMDVDLLDVQVAELDAFLSVSDLTIVATYGGNAHLPGIPSLVKKAGRCGGNHIISSSSEKKKKLLSLSMWNEESTPFEVVSSDPHHDAPRKGLLRLQSQQPSTTTLLSSSCCWPVTVYLPYATVMHGADAEWSPFSSRCDVTSPIKVLVTSQSPDRQTSPSRYAALVPSSSMLVMSGESSSDLGVTKADMSIAVLGGGVGVWGRSSGTAVRVTVTAVEGISSIANLVARAYDLYREQGRLDARKEETPVGEAQERVEESHIIEVVRSGMVYRRRYRGDRPPPKFSEIRDHFADAFGGATLTREMLLVPMMPASSGSSHLKNQKTLSPGGAKQQMAGVQDAQGRLSDDDHNTATNSGTFLFGSSILHVAVSAAVALIVSIVAAYWMLIPSS